MSTQHPDYTEDDFNILAMGEWNPGAETDETELADGSSISQGSDEENSHTRTWETDLQENEPEPASSIVKGEPDLARVELMPGGVKAAIEAILSVAQTPLSVRELSATLIVPEHTVEVALDELSHEYNGWDDGQTVHEPRGMEIRQVAGGWRLYARAEFAPWVSRYVKTQQNAKLPKSALETLSVIAYQQPITKGYVAAIRGANSESAFKTLLLYGLIRETTPDEDGIAQFATTPEFLERMGLNSLAELPPLAPYLPDIEDVAFMGEQP